MVPGSRVGPYRLEAQLGRGGMGSVWLGVHTVTGARHALKLLDVTDDAELRARLGREAEALGRLGAHPHLVTVHGAGVDAGRPWIAMELAPGGDLATRLRTGPLPPADVVALGKALAAGLAHAHARGVLHRDLKPSNVVFGDDGAPRLVDFGVARVAGAAALTRTGGVLGTPGYSAPEQLGGGGGVDARADVYGLGAVLYHALAGQPASVAATPIAAVASALQGPPAPSSVAPALRKDPLAGALEAIVLRALAFDPGDRFASAEALGQALAEVGGPAVPSRRGAGGLAALAVGAAVVGALLVAALAGGSPGPGRGTTTPPGGDPAPVPSRGPIGVGVEPLLAGLVPPDAVLARAAAPWADPAARPALAPEVSAALLLLGGPDGRDWPDGGLSAEAGAMLRACAGRSSATDDGDLGRVRAAALALEQVSAASLGQPVEILDAVDRLLRAADGAEGPAWQSRLVRVHAQRELARHAETLVHFTGLALEKKVVAAVGRAHEQLRVAEELEPGPHAAALRVLHRWALTPRKGTSLPAGVEQPALEPEAVLPAGPELLPVVRDALVLMADERYAHSPELGDVVARRGRLAALFVRAAPLLRSGGGFDRPFGELVNGLRDHDAFVAGWVVWLGRGEAGVDAALDEAWEAAKAVSDPDDRRRHRARVLLMRGKPDEALREFDDLELRDWRAVYTFEAELLQGRLDVARTRLQACPLGLRPWLELALDAAAPTIDADALRARAARLKPRIVLHLPWRGTEATQALVEAAAGGWRPHPGAPPWPPAR
jgi:hypothetical protein